LQTSPNYKVGVIECQEMWTCPQAVNSCTFTSMLHLIGFARLKADPDTSYCWVLDLVSLRYALVMDHNVLLYFTKDEIDYVLKRKETATIEMVADRPERVQQLLDRYL
jgi:hypothetical protein